MRILHITAVRSGSTGRTATDLKTVVAKKGGEYKIAFSVPDGKPLDGDILIGNGFDHKVHAFLSRLLGLQGYFSYFATRRFLNRIKAYRPDIVQLGNLHANYINLPQLFRFLATERIPVVMILHDCWFFTGKCMHFTVCGCMKWKTQCRRCPAWKTGNSSWLFDRSAKMFRDRKRWYEGLVSLTVIAVSDWEKNLARQSPLFAAANVTRVYNWIDTAVFRPASQEEKAAVADRYRLDPNTRYVLSVGAGWPAAGTKTMDAVNLARQLPDGYRLVVVGGGDAGVFPAGVVRIPYTANPRELAVLYSLAEAYIHFSVEDTFGKVIAEAMACGTVPIVFNSTACCETASPYGLVVEPHDTKAMVGVIPLAAEPDRRTAVRQYALDNYCRPQNMEVYWGESL